MNLDIFDNFFNGKKVLVTGHTGFKGSWLALWLNGLGAKVSGIALDPTGQKDNYSLCNLNALLENDIRSDIRDGETLKTLFKRLNPDIVFHLAAQPLVRLSYDIPVETYQTNVMGTINVMEAIRVTPSVKVAIMVTSDKCYENQEQIWGYRETDAMGGYDPYSSSKGAAEIAIASWRRSFFNPEQFTTHGMAIASVRAGNVIGGGDWAENRIVPDCIRALEIGEPIKIRSPKSVRPWQHVLEPLSGYMLLAKKMWHSPKDYCEGWNFGPNSESVSNVWDIATKLIDDYGEGSLIDVSDPTQPHEAKLLTLDITKVRTRLGWEPRLNIDQTVKLTVDWYRRYRQEDPRMLGLSQIAEFVDR